jgi:hypothetical protein
LLKKIYKFLFVDDLLESSANLATVKAEPLKKKFMNDLARLTLFSYVMLVFNPVVPLLADKMAHTFWLEYHLVTVHHVYGSSHVHMEMADNAKQADKDKSPGAGKSAQDDFFHIIPCTTYSFTAGYFINKYYCLHKINAPLPYPDIHYQPPKV